MKAHHLILLAGVASLSSSLAFGFAEFGRGELMLSTTARAAYDSRVWGGLREDGDYIFTIDPRLIYRREAGQLKLRGEGGLRVNRYYEYSELNSEDFVGSLKLSLPPEASSLATGSFETSYDEHTDVNYDVDQRIREKTFLTSLNADIPAGLKTTLLLGGNFRRDQRNQFSDRETREGTVGFRYLDFLGGTSFDLRYRRLEVETTGGNAWNIPLDQQSDIYTATISRPIFHDVRGSVSYGYRVLHRSSAEVFGGPYDKGGSIFAVSLVGPFLPESMFPKVESSLSLGYQKAESPGINDPGAGNRFVGAMHLAWHARERTSLIFDARRAVELTINDLTVETTGGSIGVNQQIGNFTTAGISAGYEERKYRTLDRRDDVFVATASATYRISHAWSAGADYRLRAVDSAVASSDYSRNVISVSASYLF